MINEKYLELSEKIATEVVPLYLPYITHESYSAEDGSYAKLNSEKADALIDAIYKLLNSELNNGQ